MFQKSTVQNERWVELERVLHNIFAIFKKILKYDKHIKERRNNYFIITSKYQAYPVLSLK